MTQKILLIEDNLEIAENIASILQLARYRVSHAPNGKVGIDLAQEEKPDLILCDTLMSQLNGYGVIHILNRDPVTASIPFVFMTSKTDNMDFRTGMNLGADDYITKPIDGLELLKVIEIRLKKIHQLKSSLNKTSNGFSKFQDKTGKRKEFKKLPRNKDIRCYKKKDILFMEGYFPNHLFYIEKGLVKTFILNAVGKELITGIHHEGEYLGYLPLFEEKPHHEYAEALEDTQVSLIPKNEFKTLLFSNRDVAGKFFKRLSKNLEETENRLLEVAYQSVRQRVAGVLLRIDKDIYKENPCSVISISRKDISNLIGTTNESLNRTLADFKQEKLIEVTHEGLKILHKSKLEQIVKQW